MNFCVGVWVGGHLEKLSVLNDHFEMFEKMNEKLMQRGMFLTFWLRTKNDYFNVKSELTKTLVFQSEIKTEFIQYQDELISGGFPKSWSRKMCQNEIF